MEGESELDMNERAVADLINGMFPEDYEYKVVKCDKLEIDSANVKFELELRVDVTETAGAQVFLDKFYQTSGCTFNIQSGRQDKTSDSLTAQSKVRGFRKCSMNVCEKQGKENKNPGKNTNCGAFLNFRVEKMKAKEENDRKNKQKFPLWLKICFIHNHSLQRADFLKFKSVSLSTKSEYTQMFAEGFSPSGAHTEMKRRLKSEYPDDWHMRFSDRSVLPSIFWVYYWNRRYMDSEIGSRDEIDCLMKATELIAEYNTKCNMDFPQPNEECYAKISQTDDGQTVAVICNPLMKRVHQTIPQAGDIVFIDATANIDRNDTKLFHLVCPSVIGGLPLAEILTTREDTKTIHFALELLKTVLPVGAFFGRGCELGPSLFMTDDSDSLRNGLSASWPSSELLLCQFHVLQARHEKLRGHADNVHGNNL